MDTPPPTPPLDTDPPRFVSGQFSVGVEIGIAVPAIRVWKALLEPDDMRAWFCEHAEVEPTPGGRFHFGGRYTYRLDTPEDRGQALVSVDVGRSVVFTWNVAGYPSRVRFLVTADRSDARLRVVHELEGLLHRDWREQVADHYPWENYLIHLKTHLERGDAGVRVDYTAVPQGRQTIQAPFKCAAERVWRVLVDLQECRNRLEAPVEFDATRGEGWSDLFGPVEVVASEPAQRLHHRWSHPESGSEVHIEWRLESQGVATVVRHDTWGEGPSSEWLTGDAGMWTHVLWCRVFNSMKYFAETGRPVGLRRLTAEF